MKISFHLPLEKVQAGEEFISADAIFEMAHALEKAGMSACYVTEHPAPANKWLGSGGHHALDPFVALSFAAAVTTRLRLHTNIIVIPYHNPFLTAKSVASLDVLSGGRLILGIGSGYLQDEFAALNAPFEGRGAVIDEAIGLMKKIWTGEPITHEGKFFRAPGNTVQPVPAQKPHPPIWVGGNSERAIRRAVETCDGWAPFPVSSKFKDRVRTDEIATIDDLKRKIAHARELEAKIGRKTPIEICMVPFDLGMHAEVRPQAAPIVDQFKELASAGVTWSSVSLPCRDRSQYLENVDWFAREVMAHL